MKRCTGLTLIELLTCLAVAAVLVALAVPSFRVLVLDARLVGATNDLVHAIHLARSTAVVTATQVVVCRSGAARQCVTNRPWQAGYVVFVNRDGDNPPRIDAGEPVLLQTAGFTGGRIGANRSTFLFRPFTRRSVNGTFVVCDDRGAQAGRAVIVSYTGKPRAIPLSSHKGVLKCPP